MTSVKRATIAVFLLITLLSLVMYIMNSVAPGTREADTIANTPLSFPREYVTAKHTLAGTNIENLLLGDKAVRRGDGESVRVLLQRGSIFILDKGTRVELLGLQWNIDGICIGEVESGEAVGSSVVLACE